MSSAEGKESQHAQEQRQGSDRGTPDPPRNLRPLLCCRRNHQPNSVLDQRWRPRGILLAWVLGPPVIFWLEYFCFAPLPDTEDKKVQLARLNDFRAVSQAIWAGVGAALGALYLHKP